MSLLSTGRACAAILVSVIASSLAAQSYELHGQIDNSQSSVCYYCPPITTWCIKGSETPVRSSSVSLVSFFGQDVVVTGTVSSSAAGPVVEVTSIAAAAPTFGISGNGRIGNTLRINTSGANGDLAINVVALGASFVPIDGAAVFLLNPATSVVLGLGPITGGSLQSDLPIPLSTTLVGLHLFGQGLVVPASGAPLYTTNPDVKRLQ